MDSKVGVQSGIGSGIGGALGLGSSMEGGDMIAAMESDNEEGEYEPTQEEIHGYAKFLGMDIVKDKEFLYIAEEGLKAPVPEPWMTYFNSKDEIFYVNSITNERMYDHPLDEEYRQKFLRLKAEKEAAEGK